MRVRFTGAFILFICFAVSLLSLSGCNSKLRTMHPKPIGDDEEKLEEWKAAYIELIHRAAPGTDWRAIEKQNARVEFQQKELLGRLAKTTGSFADGNIAGAWYERGNNNQAGRMDIFSYVPTTGVLYGMSDGGSVWKTKLPTGNWTLVSDAMLFNTSVLATMQVGKQTRVFLSDDTNVVYSDNDGRSFKTSNGISFPIAWGGNSIVQVYPVNDTTQTVYCLTYGWDAVSWTPHYFLYASADNGENFNLIKTFNYQSNNQVSLYAPIDFIGTLYALCVSSGGSDTLFEIRSGTVSILNSITAFPTATNTVDMKCLVAGGITHFYALVGGSSIYHSTDFGKTWSLQSTIPADNGNLLGLSTTDTNYVMYGSVEAHRSADGGQTWNLVNAWGDYYAAIATKLHADIRSINFFRDTSGGEFSIIGTDGGAYLSNNHLVTVSNLCLKGLRVNQLWDEISPVSNSDIIFGGAQDQGLQFSDSSNGKNVINAQQLLSGDYGQLRITRNDSSLWALYPGGTITVYRNFTAPVYQGGWEMPGTQKPNAAWMLPTSDYFTSGTKDEILVGGGNLTGGSGSYLIKLTASTVGSFDITATQFPYEFRSHSNSGTSGISSIAVSHINNQLIYVATEDGTFFHSLDGGITWTKSTTFKDVTGFWLYGACILPGKDSDNVVYYGGSGYSNPAVYVSRDYGQTFTPMSNGLPNTLVNRLAASPDESILFAATDAGPYAYVKKDAKWYSLADATTPTQIWNSVQYIEGANVVRFGTYGRGIWDLQVKAPVTAVASILPATMELQLVPNPVKGGGMMKIISPAQDNINITFTAMDGRNIWNQNVAANSTFNIPNLQPGIYVYKITKGNAAKTGIVSIQ
ncbi:MAG TPA: T9SS type A sorting domain-containing protein [Flavipsychrobacter sp.]|nr:T9SS type A sorting domain-containing protein [Flavipsychrobacter sp.]